MARGYRGVPYPAPEICRYLRDHGARFVLSSDSHRKDTLQFAFERCEQMCREEGLTLLDQLEWRHPS